MGTYGNDQCAPPRRGAVWSLAVDSTSRAYSLAGLNIGGYTPEATQKKRAEVYVWLQAVTNDVYFYFDSATGSSLDDAAAQSAAAGAAAFADTYAAVLKVTDPPMKFRINRALDKFIQVATVSTAGTLRMWAASESE